MLSSDLCERLKSQIEEDLAALYDLLRAKAALPPARVRVVASGILRKWLVEDLISKLALEIGCKFTLPALDTSPIFDQIRKQSHIRFFMAGGVLLGGHPTRAFYASDEPFPSAPPLSIHRMQPVELKPSAFLKQPRVYCEGITLHTREIIKFMCNKVGGIHFDTRRDPRTAEIERIASYFTLGDGVGEQIRLIEQEGTMPRFHIVLPKERGHIWNCIDVEMLAAAQSLANIKIDGHPLVLRGKS